ncbi:MAG TPA: thioredoxin [Anaerolineae bacterium]|nr:thioredoxin [Anaerolineae bacterium]
MPFNTPIHTNQHSIDRVIHAGLPVILVFWKKDCPPCHQLDPALDRLAQDYAGKLLVAKVDAASDKPLLKRFNVTALPGIVFITHGRSEAVASGAVPESDLRRWADYLTRGGARPPIPTGPSISLEPRPAPPHRNGDARPGASAATGRTAPRDEHRPLTLTDANFDSVVMASDAPVLVDFWAPWCGPCHMIAPTVEALAREFSGRLRVGKLNVDENPRIAARYGVMSIPTLLVFDKGRVVDQIVGALPAPALRQRVMRHVR